MPCCQKPVGGMPIKQFLNHSGFLSDQQNFHFFSVGCIFENQSGLPALDDWAWPGLSGASRLSIRVAGRTAATPCQRQQPPACQRRHGGGSARSRRRCQRLRALPAGHPSQGRHTILHTAAG